MMEWWINGEPGEQLDVRDRGLQYADGLFETIAVRNAQPRLLDYHLERLRHGCRVLGIADAVLAGLPEDIAARCVGLEHGVLKLIVTRGPGERGYRAPQTVRPTLIIGREATPAYALKYYRDGIAVRHCQTPVSSNPLLAGLKTLQRLDQVLARNEWDEPGVAEGLMSDAQGHVIGGTMSNVFIADGGQLYTPDLSRSGVRGVMRRAVIEQASAAGIRIEKAAIDHARLRRADEIFLSNSQFSVWPVNRVDAAVYAAGPLTRRVMDALAMAGLAEWAP